jgi:hypothetical protein
VNIQRARTKVRVLNKPKRKAYQRLKKIPELAARAKTGTYVIKISTIEKLKKYKSLSFARTV